MPKSVLSRGRSWVARITVLAMVASLMALAIPAGAQVQDTSSACPEDEIPSAGFVDLAGLNATTVQAIDCLVFYGISQGTSATTFAPNLAVPRWQMALFLTRQAEVHGVTLPDGSSQGFTDIGGLPADVQVAINQLAQLGISIGTSATTFSPFDLVSRQQMALFISRLVAAAGVTLPDGSPQGYLDISTLSAEAQLAINQITQLGIAQGTSATTFLPFAATLRWHMALFLTRTLAADGITPLAVADTFTDAPELLSVEEFSFDDDEEELVLQFNFDEEIDRIEDTDQFVVYEADGTRYEATDADTGSPWVRALFDDIDEDVLEELTLATVGKAAVEDESGDQNPEGTAPLMGATISGSAGELADLNLVDVRHEDSNAPLGPTIMIFEYDDDVLLGDVDDDFGFWIVLDGWDADPFDLDVDDPDEFDVPDDLIECEAVADSTTGGAFDGLDDDELGISCPGSFSDGDWARGLDRDGAIAPQIDNDFAGFQAFSEASTDAPDILGVEQISDNRVEITFDERVKLPSDDPDVTVDDSDDDEYNGTVVGGLLVDFAIYDEDGLAIHPEQVIVTDSDRVIRMEFPDDDASDMCGGDCDDDTVGFGDGDDDLDGDVEGAFVQIGAVQERFGDELPNAPDEERVGTGADTDVDAGIITAPQLTSVSDVEVSSTDIEGDADEWEAVFGFSEDLVENGACEEEFFSLYTPDGTDVVGVDCDVDGDEVTVTFDDEEAEDAVIGGVDFEAVESDEDGDPNPEGVAPVGSG